MISKNIINLEKYSLILSEISVYKPISDFYNYLFKKTVKE